MAKRGFRKTQDPTEGLKSQIKIETGKTYYLFVVNDSFVQYSEIWPSFPSEDGSEKRRFVGDSDNNDSNLKPILRYKKEYGIPEGLTNQDQNNWKKRTRYAAILACGTESAVKITSDMAKKKPALKKLVGKTKRKINWDWNKLGIFLFGVEIYRQFKAMNNDPDNIELLQHKGIDTDENLPTDYMYFKLTKTKKGKEAYEVDYDLSSGKFMNKIPDISETNFDEVSKDLDEYITPTPEDEISDFVSEFGSGSSGGDEVESEVETEVETESESEDESIPEIDETSDDETSDDETSDDETSDDETSDDDVNFDDIDSLLE